MLSTRLIEMIEDRSEQIAARAIEEMQRASEMPRIQKLFRADLQEWAEDILCNLSGWLAETGDLALARRYEDWGRRRFEESVPLHETIEWLHILKAKMIEYVRSEGFGSSPLEIYAEEELEHRTGRFFDWLVYHVVRGYEQAWRRSAPFRVHTS